MLPGAPAGLYGASGMARGALGRRSRAWGRGVWKALSRRPSPPNPRDSGPCSLPVVSALVSPPQRLGPCWAEAHAGRRAATAAILSPAERLPCAGRWHRPGTALGLPLGLLSRHPEARERESVPLVMSGRCSEPHMEKARDPAPAPPEPWVTGHRAGLLCLCLPAGLPCRPWDTVMSTPPAQEPGCRW